jgi:hypothetical protein
VTVMIPVGKVGSGLDLKLHRIPKLLLDAKKRNNSLTL